MATKAQAVKAIQAIGGSIDWDVSEITKTEKVITIDAPAGFVWQYNGCACIARAWYCGSASEFWSDIIEAVEDGVESQGEEA